MWQSLYGSGQHRPTDNVQTAPGSVRMVSGQLQAASGQFRMAFSRTGAGWIVHPEAIPRLCFWNYDLSFACMVRHGPMCFYALQCGPMR